MNQGTLIASVSGIRGIFSDGLDPAVLVRYTTAYGAWIRTQYADRARSPLDRPRVVVGRDARVTGPLCADIVMATLQAMGVDVVDAGLATTPTVEMAVLFEQADGGIILSASHNPAEWNALKLLNEKGEFLSPDEGRRVLDLAEDGNISYAPYDAIGRRDSAEYLERHIDAVLDLDFVDVSAIRRRGFKVVVDGVNSVGAVALPALLARFGISGAQLVLLNGEPTGLFAHSPEPLPDNLTETIQAVADHDADLGLVVDPDADRLALIANGGVYVSEELTQVIAADFLWRRREGPFVTNLSSSRAIEDVAARYGQPVYRSAVGEINVVKRMQAEEAILGGEGNGGVILPDLHYGRDALVGSVMVLQHLAERGQALSEVHAALPSYCMAKKKAVVGEHAERILETMAVRYADERTSTVDGVKIDFDEGWVHMRKSNTEPILRVYTEAATPESAEALAARFLFEVSAETVRESVQAAGSGPSA